MNTAPFNAHSSLPLSRPAFNMKMKKCKEPKAKPTFDVSFLFFKNIFLFLFSQPLLNESLI